jgi:hypothetical protein
MRFQSKVATLLVVVALAGCNAAPILNVDSAAATNAAGKAMSKDQVRAAIVRAGAALGWQMKDEGPNMVVASITLRNHSAVVEIPYSATSYSIKYRSSANLGEVDGKIHKNYNGWVQNLTKGINAQLSAS